MIWSTQSIDILPGLTFDMQDDHAAARPYRKKRTSFKKSRGYEVRRYTYPGNLPMRSVLSQFHLQTGVVRRLLIARAELGVSSSCNRSNRQSGLL